MPAPGRERRCRREGVSAKNDGHTGLPHACGTVLPQQHTQPANRPTSTLITDRSLGQVADHIGGVGDLSRRQRRRSSVVACGCAGRLSVVSTGPVCDNLTTPRGRRRRCSAGTPNGCSRKSACTRAGAPFQALRLPSARLAEPAVMSRAASSLAVIGSPCRPLEPRPRPPWSRVGRAKRRGIAYRALCGRGDLCPDVRRLPRRRAAADAGLISGSSADGPCRGRGGAGCGRLTCWSSMMLSTAPVRRSSHRSGAGDQRLHQGSADSGHGHVRAARSHQTTTIDDGAARRTNQHPALDRSPAFTRVAEVKAATRKRDGGGEAIRGA